MGTAKQELDAIVAHPNWDWPESIHLKDAIAQLIKQLDYFVDVVIPESWKGDAAIGATQVVVDMRQQWVTLQREAAEAPHHIANANQALNRARQAAQGLPSPVVPHSVRSQVTAALNDGKSEVIIDGVAWATDTALSGIEWLFGNREEQAAQVALRELEADLEGPRSRLRVQWDRLYRHAGVNISIAELEEMLGPENLIDDTSSWKTDGGGGNYYRGGTPPTPNYNGGPGGGGPVSPNPTTPDTPYRPGDPQPPGLPYPPYIPPDRDDSISIDDGSTGWHGRGMGAGMMGALGVGGALAARSALSNSGSAAGANAAGAGAGQGGLLGAGGGASGVGGANAGGLAGGGRSGGNMGMMGGQGGRGGDDKDKKPSLAGYTAPKLEDDDEGFTPLPDSARAGGRNTEADENL